MLKVLVEQVFHLLLLVRLLVMQVAVAVGKQHKERLPMLAILVVAVQVAVLVEAPLVVLDLPTLEVAAEVVTALAVLEL